MTRSLTLVLILAGAALALRLPNLNQRPMHNDEAVNAVVIHGFWRGHPVGACQVEILL